MPTVKLDPSFKKITDGKTAVKVEAQSVKQALDFLDEKYSGFGKLIFDGSSRLQNFVLIYVDDQDIRYGQGLKTPLNPDSTMLIVKAVAGG